MLVGRRLGAMPSIGCRSIRIDPSVGESKPAIILSSVVLPQPDGPSREKNSPSLMVREELSSALNAPKLRVTLRISIIGRSGNCSPRQIGAPLGPAPQDLG